MIAFTAIWLLLGLITLLILFVLALAKKFKWKLFGLILAVYLVLSFALLVIAGSFLPADSHQTSERSNVKIFKLIYSDDEKYEDGIRFESNGDGKYTVKVRGLHNGKIKLANKDDDQEKFQTRYYKIKKEQTLKIPIQLKGDDLVHDFKITDNNHHSKTFSIYNNSGTANSIANSFSESEKNASNDDKSDADTSTHKKYSKGKDVAHAINEAAANDPRLNGLHVTYKGSIFYVNIPTEVTQLDDNEQKSVYRNVARMIHSFQKTPTGVICFEDEQGNIVATTKAFNNNDVKLK